MNYFSYSVTLDNLPNSTHLCNFVSTDDIVSIFEPQLKQVKRDQLLEDQFSCIALKNLTALFITMLQKFDGQNGEVLY